MTHLVKIGNSQGIRIPKPLVEQAQLEGKELKLQLVSNGLLISPEKIDAEWLDLPLASDDDLEW